MDQKEAQSAGNWIRYWLVLGLVLVAGQIFLGGITRLTGSGLSITKWDIIIGTVPPMNDEAWEEVFALYKDTPQYRLINQGMSMASFKWIYFWEYMHRLWARMMGLVFIFPFLFFVWKQWLSRKMILRLAVLIVLVILTASFGWIMVASGLIDRPWVNAYKLSLHLILGFSVFWFLYYIFLFYKNFEKPVICFGQKYWRWVALLVILQIWLGGMVSGMKAGSSYPTWPLMHDTFIPAVLLDLDNWKIEHFIAYDDHQFMSGFSQFFHRMIAYLIVILIFIGVYKKGRLCGYQLFNKMLIGTVLVQILLGIWTVISFRDGVPVIIASMHQLGGLMLSTVIFRRNMVWKDE